MSQARSGSTAPFILQRPLTKQCDMMSPSQIQTSKSVGRSPLLPRSSSMKTMLGFPPRGGCSQVGTRAAESPHLKRRRRTQKAVTFAEEALQYPTTLSVDEAASMWYSRHELDDFKAEKRNLVKLLKRYDFDVKRVGNYFCLRGLEPYFSLDANRSIKNAREHAMQTAFGEQERQRASGLQEPEILRSVIMEATRPAQLNALQLGINDANDSRAIYEAPLLEELALRAEKGLSLGTRRGVVKTPSLTQQEATSLSRALQQRQD